jgi:hypothetical protein
MTMAEFCKNLLFTTFHTFLDCHFFKTLLFSIFLAPACVIRFELAIYLSRILLKFEKPEMSGASVSTASGTGS